MFAKVWIGLIGLDIICGNRDNNLPYLCNVYINARAKLGYLREGVGEVSLVTKGHSWDLIYVRMS